MSRARIPVAEGLQFKDTGQLLGVSVRRSGLCWAEECEVATGALEGRQRLPEAASGWEKNVQAVLALVEKGEVLCARVAMSAAQSGSVPLSLRLPGRRWGTPTAPPGS